MKIMLHERALRNVLNNHMSDFEAQLHKSNVSSNVSSHHRNIQMLIIEITKSEMNLLHQSWIQC